MCAMDLTACATTISNHAQRRSSPAESNIAGSPVEDSALEHAESFRLKSYDALLRIFPIDRALNAGQGKLNSYLITLLYCKEELAILLSVPKWRGQARESGEISRRTNLR